MANGADEVEIDLRYMGLLTVPDGLPELGYGRYRSTIKVIDLSNNRISSLPSDFRKFSQLEYLDVGFNRLKAFPSIYPPKMKKLFLNNNELTALPSLDGFDALTDL